MPEALPLSGRGTFSRGRTDSPRAIFFSRDRQTEKNDGPGGLDCYSGCPSSGREPGAGADRRVLRGQFAIFFYLKLFLGPFVIIQTVLHCIGGHRCIALETSVPTLCFGCRSGSG